MNLRIIDMLRTLSFLLCLLLAAGSAAAVGPSTPSYIDSTLRIPRIDVEGFGSLDVSLRLDDASALLFSISASSPADPSLTPGATYSLSTSILDIPQVQVGTDLYHVAMLLEGETFKVTVADLIQVVGKTDYEQQCASCHGSDGLGGSVAISLVNCANCGSLSGLTSYIENVMPLGLSSNCVGSCASEVADYVINVLNTSDEGIFEQTIQALQTMAPTESLRKASLHLLGRLPTATELAEVEANGEAGLRSVVDQMMEDPDFYVRLSEIFNDRLLTNRYLSSNGAEAAISLLRGLPNLRWFDPGQGQRDAEYQTLRLTTNDSLASEPLELINYVVRNNLPMTEVLTADYFLVNGYSAKSYGLQDSVTFNDEWDASEYRPAQFPGLPHAGLLTSPMFLNRYPTSATNRNRGRSRVVYDLFLDVDILALDGVRPDGGAVDISSPAPTMDNDDCVACHSLLDPVASSFQNWNRRGIYQPGGAWYDDMFQAGFAGIDRPASAEAASLQWLSGEIARDARFDDAIVRILYSGLTGNDPLDPPAADAPTAEREAFLAESGHLSEIKANYVAANRNLKTLVGDIILSPYWLADGLGDAAFAVVHAQTGSAKLLTPELLHRKINAVLGFEWRGNLDNYSTNKDLLFAARLLDKRFYFNQIYGGIDSFNVTERLTTPNGLIAAVQERMANELACYAVPNDFLYDSNNRVLLPLVESFTTPNSSADQTLIKRNIQHLHKQILGEDLALDDPEVEATYALFAEVWQTGQAELIGGQNADLPILCRRNFDIESGTALANHAGTSGPISQDPNYVMRSWMAVVAYLLSDYRFLYE